MTDAALDAPNDDAPMPANRSRRIIAATLAITLVIIGAFAAGRITAPQTGTPSTTSVEAGFARDMQLHHNQAVEMSLLVRTLTDEPRVSLLAYDIATSQSSQSGQLYGSIAEWNLPQAPSEPIMTWMSRPTLSGSTHDMLGMSDAASGDTAGDYTYDMPHEAGGAMPGMATGAQMAELATLTGADAEKFFLELMIEHHKGGVVMAEALLERSDYRTMVSLANGVVIAQSGEIELMENLLARY